MSRFFLTLKRKKKLDQNSQVFKEIMKIFRIDYSISQPPTVSIGLRTDTLRKSKLTVVKSLDELQFYRRLRFLGYF